MKYLNKILLFSLLVFAFACDKDDDNMDPDPGEEDPIEMTPEEIAEAALSNDSGWTITAIETNLDVLEDEVRESDIENAALSAGYLNILYNRLDDIVDCETDDVIKFSDNLSIDYNDGADVCTADGTTQYELLFANGTWDLKDANTLTITTSFNGETSTVDYTINTLTDNDFVLSSSVDANEGVDNYIEVGSFQFTNTLDTKITMTKAN